jgi:seryl-tRNA synthetase
LNEKNVELD